MTRPQIKNLTYMDSQGWEKFVVEQENYIDFQEGVIEDKDAEINELQHKIQELEGVVADSDKRFYL